MARELSEELGEAIADRVVRPFLAVYIGFPDPVYGWTGTGIINFADQEWTGLAGVAAIDTIGETTDGSATGFSGSVDCFSHQLARLDDGIDKTPPCRLLSVDELAVQKQFPRGPYAG